MIIPFFSEPVKQKDTSICISSVLLLLLFFSFLAHLSYVQDEL